MYGRLGKRLAAFATAWLIAQGPCMAAGWISPDGYEDPNNAWSTESLAYDGNQTTYASDSPRMDWAHPIVFTFTNNVLTSRLRVYADFGFDHTDMVRVEIRRTTDGIWTNVHEGAIEHSAWHEIEFPQESIDAVRYRYHYIMDNWIFWLYELQVYEDPPEITQPTASTEAATSVEEYTAILQGLVADDGGEPCEYRFQYGLTDAYSTNTPWTENKVTDDTFTHVLTGLMINTTYHFRAQLRNSIGTNSGDNLTFYTQMPRSGWLSPTDYHDPDSAWIDEFNAFDDHHHTWVRCAHDIGEPVWGPWFYLTHSTMQCDGVRFIGRGGGEIDDAHAEVDLNGVWTTVYSNTMPNMEWVNAYFTQGTVTQARIRFKVTDPNFGLDWQLNEFDFHRVVGVTLSGDFPGTNPVSLAVNGLFRASYTGASPYVFNESIAEGDLLLMYRDDDASGNDAALAALATDQDMTHLHLTASSLVVRSESAGSITASDLASALIADSDIPYSGSATGLTLHSGIDLIIPEGQTLYPSDASIELPADLINNGTLQADAGTFHFVGDSAVLGNSTSRFCHMEITGSLNAHAGRMHIRGDVRNDGSWDHGGGTVVFDGDSDINGSAPLYLHNVHVSGDLTGPAGSLFVAGNWDGSSGTYHHNGGSVVLNGTNTQTILTGGAWNGATNHWKNDWYALTVANTSTQAVYFADGFRAAQFTADGMGAPLYFRHGDDMRNVFEVYELDGLQITGMTNQLITLRPYGGGAGDRWLLRPPESPGAWTVACVDVKDARNLYRCAIGPTNSVDSGNNVYWFMTPIEQWKTTVFTPEELDHPDISGNDADPDGDGMNNLAEYAFGEHPKTNNAPCCVVAGPDDTYDLSLEYTRRKNLYDVEFDLMKACAIYDWIKQNDWISAMQVIDNGDGIAETVTLSIQFPPTCEERRLYFRLRITLLNGEE